MRDSEHAVIRLEKDMTTVLESQKEMKATLASLVAWQKGTVAVIAAGTFVVMNWEKIKALFS